VKNTVSHRPSRVAEARVMAQAHSARPGHPARLAAVLTLFTFLIGPALAHADEAPRAAANARHNASTGPVGTPRRGEWRWWLVIPSLGASAALLTYGLSIDCADADTECQRKASLAIWGSMGMASAGTLLGIRIVQVGRAHSPASTAHGSSPRTREVRLQLTPSWSRAGSPLHPGAVLQLTGELP
jgi:hypothetical protein